MMVAAVEDGSGLVLGRVEADSKSNEIPAVRAFATEISIAGRVVTLDAMHAQQRTAQILCDNYDADHVATSIKENQPTMYKDLKAIDWSGIPAHTTVDKGHGHGRIEVRRCQTIDLTGSE